VLVCLSVRVPSADFCLLVRCVYLTTHLAAANTYVYSTNFRGKAKGKACEKRAQGCRTVLWPVTCPLMFALTIAHSAILSKVTL